MFCKDTVQCCRTDDPEIEVRANPNIDDVRCGNDDARIQVVLPTEQEVPSDDPKSKESTEFMVEFYDEQGAKQRFTFPRGRALGIGFRNEKPASVGQVLRNSVAEVKGIKIGWKLLRVSNEDVTNYELNDILAKFEHLAMTISTSLSSLTMEFQSDNGEKKNVEFTSSPLKMGFSMHKPYIVDQIDSTCAAYKAGVRSGWKVLKLADESIDTQEWRNVLEKIKQTAKRLPGATVD